MAADGGDADGAPPPVRVVRLKRRREFLAVAGQGRRWVTPAFVLQAGRRPARGGDDAEAAGREIGIGFTASRRVGKAVERNRARRRLREAMRRVLPGPARPGFDYVVVARPEALSRPFASLLDELRTALARAPSARPRRRDGGPRGGGAGRPGIAGEAPHM
ncbi:MAG TPA: ribonuclease P protein component [Geminicoccaceae bacterium]|nr:ribonuclease P protein component [Geminicoccaceae bacterium]